MMKFKSILWWTLALMIGSYPKALIAARIPARKTWQLRLVEDPMTVSQPIEAEWPNIYINNLIAMLSVEISRLFFLVNIFQFCQYTISVSEVGDSLKRIRVNSSFLYMVQRKYKIRSHNRKSSNIIWKLEYDTNYQT